jgi:hypothetical protein
MNINTAIRSTDSVRADTFVDRISIVVGEPGEDLWIVMSVEKAAELRAALDAALATTEAAPAAR